MPRFQYLAKRSPTEMVEGFFESENRSGVIVHLMELGYTPVRVLEAQARQAVPAERRIAPLSGSTRVPRRALHQFTRQFASLVRSQVPILRGLSILEEQTSHPRLRRVIASVAEEIRQGQTLSGALERYPRIYPPLYISLIRSGEAGGMLDTVLDRLAVQADREEELESKIRGSLAYPLFVLVAGILTVCFLFWYVIPRMVKLFDVFGAELPLPTRVLLGMAGWLSQGWFWVVGAAVGLSIAWVCVVRREAGRRAVDALMFWIPGLRALLQQMEIVRFARSFGLLIEHGIPILQATDLVLPVVRNRLLRRDLSRLPAHLKEGRTLSEGLRGLKLSTPFLVNTVAVGEESGRIGEALTEVAGFYEREVERGLQILTTLLEPAVILLVGGVVGFVVIAVLLPILTMSTVAR